MSEPKLIFKIEKRDNVNWYSLSAKFPSYIFPIKLNEILKKHSDFNDKQLIQLAVNELKIQMAKEILSFDWEIGNE
jgi:hypothetical protein